MQSLKQPPEVHSVTRISATQVALAINARHSQCLFPSFLELTSLYSLRGARLTEAEQSMGQKPGYPLVNIPNPTKID